MNQLKLNANQPNRTIIHFLHVLTYYNFCNGVVPRTISTLSGKAQMVLILLNLREDFKTVTVRELASLASWTGIADVAIIEGCVNFT